MNTKDIGFAHFLMNAGVKSYYFDKLPLVKRMKLWNEYQEFKRERDEMLDEIISYLSD